MSPPARKRPQLLAASVYWWYVLVISRAGLPLPPQRAKNARRGPRWLARTIVVERLSCALQFQLIQSTSPLNSRYVVGIDLGTTNCALAVRDASAPEDSSPIEV